MSFGQRFYSIDFNAETSAVKVECFRDMQEDAIVFALCDWQMMFRHTR